jgi:hypothetical protein
MSSFNRYAMEMYGKREDEPYGIDPFEIIHPEELPLIRNKFRAILEHDAEDVAEARVCVGGDPHQARWFILHARKTV